MCMDFAIAAAKRSTCLRRQIGAVVVHGGRPISVGYNGAPEGMPHCTPDICNAATACKNTIHAEKNAIGWAARMGVPCYRGDLYSTVSPCEECVKLILASGINRVIFLDLYRVTEPLGLLIQGGVQVLSLLNDGRLMHWEKSHVGIRESY